MFVKILEKNQHVENNYFERTYDCKQVFFSEPGHDKDDKNYGCLVINTGEPDERPVSVNCIAGTQIIYMNDQGKTIDRKFWNKP